METKILITGAGGFIGGSLVDYFYNKGYRNIRAVDIKPIPQWYRINHDIENLSLDLSIENNCLSICQNIDEVYNLAANMGGMGLIENFRIECMRNILINIHMLEASYVNNVDRFFFSSSACIYNTYLQQNTNVVALKESDAYPPMPERGYGWEKLMSELLCQEYWHERKLKTFIARFHNVYGPFGSWKDGREKAPAAICRKIIEAQHLGLTWRLERPRFLATQGSNPAQRFCWYAADRTRTRYLRRPRSVLAADGEEPDNELCTADSRYTILVRPNAYLLVIDSVFSSSRQREFYFGDQDEMGVGIRLATPLAVTNGGRMLDSEGRVNEKQIWGRTANWCDCSGDVAGQRLGMTLMADPANFRKSWMHARDYGFVAANPFGVRAFTKGEANSTRRR